MLAVLYPMATLMSRLTRVLAEEVHTVTGALDLATKLPGLFSTLNW